jgi:hypothetical protein
MQAVVKAVRANNTGSHIELICALSSFDRHSGSGSQQFSLVSIGLTFLIVLLLSFPTAAPAQPYTTQPYGCRYPLFTGKPIFHLICLLMREQSCKVFMRENH